jgi:hypothetical protein
MKNISYQEFLKIIENAIPGADVDVDNEGQLVVYTGKKVIDDVVVESDDYDNDSNDHLIGQKA